MRLFLFIFLSLSILNLNAQELQLITEAEAENGILSGVIISSANTGYSGTGYVTGFNNPEDQLTVTVTIPENGFYKLQIRYNGPYGDKYQDVSINGRYFSSVSFPATTTYSVTDADSYEMNQGENTITLKSSWGWTDIDKFSVFSTVPNSYNIDSISVDTSVNEETIALYNFLLRQFGHRVLSGQTHDNYSTIKNLTGKSPLIRIGDMQPFTEGYPYIWVDGKHTFGKGDNGSVEALISWYNNSGKKGIVGYQWHWHSPTGGEAGTNTFYTTQTSFDIRQAVISGTPENLDIIRDIDDVSGELKKFRDAGVPILWRPLHEAGGGWFWWGAQGPEPCLALYDIIFDRMMNHHQLNNLIWIWSTPEAEWYPGNDKVDMIGYDSYPGNFNYGIQKNFFDQLYNITGGEKLIAMTENGPIPDIDECLRLDAPWLYFMSWSNLVTEQNSIDHLNDVYNNPIVLTLESTNAVTPVSVPESSSVEPLLFWPNPVVDFLNCKLPGGEDKEIVINITDMNGRKYFNFKPLQDTFSLNLKHLPPGIYLFQYISSKYSQKSLFVKN